MAEIPPFVTGFIRGASGTRGFRVPTVRDAAPPVETCSEIPGGSDPHARSSYSPDGRLLAVASAESIGVFETDPSSGAVAQIQTIPHPGALGLSFSPSGAVLVAWSRWTPQNSEPNMVAWDLASAEPVSRWSSRDSPRDVWPQVFWSADEAIVARTRTNEVILNANRPADAPDARIRVSDVASCSVAPGRQPYKVATFTPPLKGMPAFVKVFSFGELDQVSIDLQPVAQTSFFRAEMCSFLWQPNGKVLIAKADCASDAQNKSYYGECQLYYIQADGKGTQQVPLDKEGPVHDVQWAPSGTDFIVIYGFMPGKATLFGEKCLPRFEFGNMAVNTVLWSPHCRFVALAGFGSLNGDIEFWDTKSLKKVGAANSRYAVEARWSPDSRHLATAVTAPRRRTDFCFKMFSYHGVLEHEQSTEELYQMGWAPALRGSYPDRAISPGRAAGVNANATQAKAGKYVPPSARGKGGEANAARVREMLDAERGTGASAVGPRKVENKKDPNVPLSKAALKNQKKREAKKRAAAAAAEAGESAAPKPEPEAVEPAPAEQEVVEEDPELVKQKKIKKIQRTLRQITETKDKGGPYNEDQLAKLAKEPQLLEELEELMR